MNILFVLYGGLGTNSAIPLGLHSRELARAGHACAVALPVAPRQESEGADFHGRVVSCDDALRQPGSLFPDGRPADVVHAWTPRENVRRFVTAWLARHPAPLVVYLEDNEGDIAQQVLAVDTDALLRLGDDEISARLPDSLSHPFRFESFTGLADAAVVIQDKLGATVPPWVPCHTVMPGVDLELFGPRAADPALRERHGIAPGERVIVYPGGLNVHTRPGIRALCEAVGLLNAQGHPCRLLRTGPFPLDFLAELPAGVREHVTDLGEVPRTTVPQLLALADVLVQPGKPDAFEDLRLPGKLPELLATGKPVVLPDTNIAHLLQDGVDALLTRTGTAQEIAQQCLRVFADPALAARVGEGGRAFAERRFDPAAQARALLAVYQRARDGFDLQAAQRVWGGANADTPPAQLLADRLELLAAGAAPAQLDARTLLSAHARLLARTQARRAGADAVAHQLRSERDRIAHELRSAEERIEHELRPAEERAEQLARELQAMRRRSVVYRVQRLRALVRHKGGLPGFLAAAWRIAGREGWSGVRRRLASLAGGPGRGAAPGDPESPADRDDYAEWVRRYDQPGPQARARLRALAAGLPARPLISIVMPTYNSNPRWLAAAIASVQAQVYDQWELCVADDASTDAEVRAVLTRHAQADPRIKLRFLERNGHICAASNAALELATGEWIALLDHDDVLAEDALFWVADAIQRHPGVRLLYSDEDKLDPAGRRVTPYFKSDWNPDLFYSHNLVTHLGVYHAALVREVGGFTLGLEGAQDYDLALRCTERIAPSQVHHIPRILYHWRMHAESTAQSAEAKPYAAAAGVRALEQHLRRRGVAATVSQTPCGYRVRYALPATPPKVSLIIPTRNGLHLLRRCVDSILRKTSYENYEIIVVDNGSDDRAALAYLQDLRSNPKVRVIRDESPFNFSALNNAAVAVAEGELVGLLNNDLEVISPDWLGEMVSLALQPGVGAVGARLLYPNGTVQHAGVVLGVGGVAGHAHKHLPGKATGYFGRAGSLQSFSAVTAACLVIRKSIYQQVGGLDEVRLAVAFNDIDFCLRVREAGFRNVWTPFADLYHHESATRGLEDTPQKQARFAGEVQTMMTRWGDALRFDPAYNPNLTLSSEDFGLAWPPRLPPLALPLAGGAHAAPLAEAAGQEG